MADPVASIGKVIVKHLPTNEDLIGCIKKICVENGIRCGQILSVIGSIRHLTIECIVVSDESESGFGFLGLFLKMKTVRWIRISMEHLPTVMEIFMAGMYWKAKILWQ